MIHHQKHRNQPYVVIVLVLDNNEDKNEDGYEDLYTTLKRVQAIIDRKLVEHSEDDCGKLSETLTKLVETWTGPKVMNLWSENPRVSTVHFHSIDCSHLKLYVKSFNPGCWSEIGFKYHCVTRILLKGMITKLVKWTSTKTGMIWWFTQILWEPLVPSEWWRSSLSYSITSVGHWADPSFLAVSPQVT